MKRWIGLLALSLAIGATLAWLARPLELSIRWGGQPEQSATVRLDESTARAEYTPEEQKAIADVGSMSSAFTAIARDVSPSVVTIYSERTVAMNRERGRNPFGGMLPDDFFGRFFEIPDHVQRGMGSGVIISPDGRVLTNNHVVANADRVRVNLADGRSFDAKVVGRDPKSDVAVVQIEASDLPAARLGSSEAIQVGEWVLAIGNPFELKQTVTAGIVSAKGRSSVGLADYEDFIQTDAAINPGNSGGALVNLRGEVIGINTAIASRTGGYQGVGFAIPIDMARKIMESLVEKGRVVRGYMGVTIQNVDPALADNYGLERPMGALVNDIMEGGPAEEAGIQAGDLIVALNGNEVRDRDELRLRIGETAPGSTIDVTVLRDGKRRSFDVKLEELPGSEDDSETPAEESNGRSLENLGFDVQPLDRALRQRFELESGIDGLVVTSVRIGSPAYDAGIREGDVILEAGREPVDSVGDLRNRIKQVDAGKTLLMKIHRGEANLFLALRVPKK